MERYSKLRLVAANVGDETLRVLPPDEDLDTFAQRVSGARREVADRVHEHD